MDEQLCFEVSFTGLTYSVIDRNSKSVLHSGKLVFNDRFIEDNLDKMKELLTIKELLSFSGHVSLAVQNSKSTLIPQNIFSETSAKEVFQLCFGESKEEVDYNRFYEQGLVNVYELPTWLKRFFVMRYPHITIQHENTHALRYVFAKSVYAPSVHLILHPDFFTLIIAEKNKLVFYNSFEYKNSDDIVYHTLFVLNQKEMKLNALSFHIDEDDAQFTQEIESAFQKIYSTNQFNSQTTHKIKHQLLCV
jgi:hypothetical protein